MVPSLVHDKVRAELATKLAAAEAAAQTAREDAAAALLQLREACSDQR